VADRQVKRRSTTTEPVGEYWIVDVDARIVERWRATDERPEIVTTSLKWHPEPSMAPFELDLPAFSTTCYAIVEARNAARLGS